MTEFAPSAPTIKSEVGNSVRRSHSIGRSPAEFPVVPPAPAELKQSQPANTGISHAVNPDRFSIERNNAVVPEFQIRPNRCPGLFVLSPEQFERALRKSDTKAERRILGILLDNADFVIATAPSQQTREIEPCRSCPNDRDFQSHGFRSARPECRDVAPAGSERQAMISAGIGFALIRPG